MLTANAMHICCVTKHSWWLWWLGDKPDTLHLQISEKTGTPVTDVKNVIIWGNHSSTQYPDVNQGTVGGQPIRKVVKDDEWLNGEFISTVQQRGATIIKASHLSHSLSKHWFCACALHSIAQYSLQALQAFSGWRVLSHLVVLLLLKELCGDDCNW